LRTPFPITDHGLAQRLARRGFPRSAAYDPWWVVENRMGPHPLWLAESLMELASLRPGARVLDLGCGRALTSIFMAREFGVQVTAADFWIDAEDNRARISAAGLDHAVTAIHAEAHALPFEMEAFDAIVSFDAYHYFGTDDLYLAYIARFLKPGGMIGIVVPGVAAEFDEVPEHLSAGWDPAFWSFHSPSWWRRHWERSELVAVSHADLVPGGWKLWADWERLCVSVGAKPLFPGDDAVREAEMLETDAGRTLGFSRVLAVKR